MAKFMVLRRFTSPSRWRDIELLFELHGLKISEIVLEDFDMLMDNRGLLLTSQLSADFMADNAQRYTDVV